jgi:hypothetical protein
MYFANRVAASSTLVSLSRFSLSRSAAMLPTLRPARSAVSYPTDRHHRISRLDSRRWHLHIHHVRNNWGSSGNGSRGLSWVVTNAFCRNIRCGTIPC